MSIVKCPNCGKHTSSIETVCPHCGNQLIDELVNIPEPTPTYYNKNNLEQYCYLTFIIFTMKKE